MHPTGLPGTNAARHGSDGRLIAMNAAHAAFRLTSGAWLWRPLRPTCATPSDMSRS
jgi:hypothetical protein